MNANKIGKLAGKLVAATKAAPDKTVTSSLKSSAGLPKGTVKWCPQRQGSKYTSSRNNKKKGMFHLLVI